MAITIITPQQWTTQQKVAALEAGGRKRNRPAGGWVADIVAQKKVITLCELCKHKFNPARVHYRKEKEFPWCQAKCDGCSTWDPKCSWYIYDELYSQVRSTTEERRALAKSREKRLKQGHL